MPGVSYFVFPNWAFAKWDVKFFFLRSLDILCCFGDSRGESKDAKKLISMLLKFEPETRPETTKQSQRRSIVVMAHKGKFTGKDPYLVRKSMVSCRFSLKPIH